MSNASIVHPSVSHFPYRILSLIGRGGMAEVYKVEDYRNGQILALKKILKTDTLQIHRFRREFRAMQKLSHPGLINVFDYGIWDGVPYFTMEWVKGINLHDAIWQKSRFVNEETQTEEIKPEDLTIQRPGEEQISRAVALVIKVCQPLSYVHKSRLIHRDLKPNNILVTENDEIKLMDFGVVRPIDATIHTQPGSMVGTIFYMSPEQGQGQSVDVRSDLYSLGIILYELTTGERPFKGVTVFEVFRQHLETMPVPPRYLNPHIPLALEALILQLLEKDPNRRIQHAKDLEVRLKQLASKTETLEEQQSIEMASPILFRPRLAGRQEAIRVLLERFKATTYGHGSLVWISGESGIGKTRLVIELYHRLRLQRLRFWRGLATPGEPLSLFQDILLNVFQTLKDTETDPHRLQQLGKWGKIIGRIAPVLDRLSFVRVLPDLPILSVQEEKVRLLDAVRNIFLWMSQDKPLVLLLDDLHWADELSFDILGHLARTLLQKRESNEIEATTSESTHIPKLLILATFRDDEIPPYLYKLQRDLDRRSAGIDTDSIDSTIRLQRLEKSEIAEMAGSMMGVNSPPSILIERLARESEGNPLFIEEIMKSFVSEGFLLYTPSGWQTNVHVSIQDFLHPVHHTPLSAQMRAVITQRLDRLKDQAKEVLACAAILGPQFSFDLLLHISGIPEDLLLDTCDELLKQGVLVEVQSAQEHYRFYHDKLREICLESLQERRKRRLHQKVAEVFETMIKDDLPITTLANHFLAAGLERRALPYLIQAGDYARKSYQNDEAIGYYTKALEIVTAHIAIEPDLLSSKKDLLKFRGEVFEQIGKYDAAKSDYQILIEIAGIDQDETSQALGHTLLGSVALAQGDSALAESLTQTAMDRFFKKNDLTGVLRALNKLGGIRSLQGLYTESLQTYQKALSLSRQIGQSEETARSLIAIGNLLIQKGEIERAIDTAKEANEVAKECGYRKGVARSMNTLARAYAQQGAYTEAADCFRASLSLKEEIGDRMGVLVTSSNLGCIAHMIGRSGEALKRLRVAFQIFQELNTRWAEPILRANMGHILLDLGAFEQAEHMLAQALSLAKEMDRQEILCEIWFLTSQLHEATHRPDQMLTYLENAITIAKKVNRTDVELLAKLKYLQLKSSQKSISQIRYQRLLSAGHRNGNPELLAKLHLGIATWLFQSLKKSHMNEALNQIKQATQLATNHHLLWVLWQSLVLEANIYEHLHWTGSEGIREKAVEIIHDIADHADAYRETFLKTYFERHKFRLC